MKSYHAFLPLFLFSVCLSATHVSVYYYPWYNVKFWTSQGVPSYIRSPQMLNQPPLLGHYNNSTNTDAIKQHLEWSVNFGIDNWICEWAGPNMYHNTAIHNYVAPVLAGSKVTFAIFYGINRFIPLKNGLMVVGPAESDTMYAHIKFMAAEYFSHPNYWRIKGKPVVVVYLSRLLAGDWVAALDRIRKDFSVYLIGDEFHMGKPVPDHLKHWDAITSYSTHGRDIDSGYPERSGYISSAKKVFSDHRRAADSLGIDFIPSVIPGYNDRGVRLSADKNIISRQVHPDSSHISTFTQSFVMAKTVTDSELDAIAVCSWNEWMEDTGIEPSIVTGATNNDGTPNKDYTRGYFYKGYGAGYLEAILSLAGRNADASPAITVTAPEASPGWSAGSRQTIRWTYTGTIYYVRLEYLAGSEWKVIESRIGNTGSYSWTVPADARQPVLVRVGTFEGVYRSTNNPANAVQPRTPVGAAFAVRHAPGSRMIWISLCPPDVESSISIYTMQGSLLRKLRVNMNGGIDIGKQPEGLYFLAIQTGGKTLVHKLLL
jgi:hypothetical protein